MKRSFYEFNENSQNLINNKLVIEADRVIVSAAFLLNILKNNLIDEEIFNNLFKKNKLFLKVGEANFKEMKVILKQNNYSFIAGFYLENCCPKFLNKMTDYARCFEKDYKLSFGSLVFICEVSTPKGAVNIKKFCNYDRTAFVTFKTNKFKDFLNLKALDEKYYYNLLLEYAFYYKKWVLLDGVQNLDEYKDLGIVGAITNDIKYIDLINKAFIPSKKEITEADQVFTDFLNSQKEKSHFDEHKLSVNKLLYSNLILERASLLNEYDNDNFSIINSNPLLLKTKKEEIKKFYTFGEEIGNSITHGLGIIAGIVFLVLLMVKLIGNFTAINFTAYLVYTLSVIILYTSSFVYHLLPLGSTGKKIFNKLDHMTIYLLIAGSYTPFALLALGGTQGYILFSIIWFGALSGLILNLFWFGKLRGFHIFLYLLLGWSAVFFIVPIINNLGTAGTILLFAGGVSYTLGVLFYGFKLFKFTHMVWHIFVLCGTILHFLSIYLYL